MKKNKATKKEVYFIATKYGDNPIKIDYYTKTGEHVPHKAVEKVQTTAGTQFFTASNN